MEQSTEVTTGSVTNVCQSGPITDTLVATVAEAKGVDPLDLEPLYESVDPDALNAMFHPSGTPPSASMEIRFSMADCDVVVRGDGEVVVTPVAGNAPVRPTIVPQND